MEQKGKWLIKITCVVAAFALWLYISNTEENSTTYKLRNIPVQLLNTEYLSQSKLKILPGQDFTVTLDVKGVPADIVLARDKFKVVADMSEFAVHKGDNKIQVKILDHPFNIYVLNNESYYINVTLDDLAEKSFPVKVTLDGKAKDGYYAFQQMLKPTDFIVSGAAKYVNEVASVVAKGEIKNATKDVDLTLPLQALDAAGKVIDDVDIQPKYVEVIVPIKKTKTVPVNIKYKGNISKELYLKSVVSTPDKVDIAGGDNIDQITSIDTEPIDLSSVNINKPIQAKLIVPDGVTLINSDGTVSIKASVDKIIQSNLQLDIQVKNLGDQLTVALDTPKISLIVLGPESVINSLKPGDISCNVDVNNLGEGTYDLPINVVITPDGITKVSVSPQTVKVTITKKSQ